MDEKAVLANYFEQNHCFLRLETKIFLIAVKNATFRYSNSIFNVHGVNLAQRRPSFVNKFPTNTVGQKSLSFSVLFLYKTHSYRSLANSTKINFHLPLKFLQISIMNCCSNQSLNGQQFDLLNCWPLIYTVYSKVYDIHKKKSWNCGIVLKIVGETAMYSVLRRRLWRKIKVNVKKLKKLQLNFGPGLLGKPFTKTTQTVFTSKENEILLRT